MSIRIWIKLLQDALVTLLFSVSIILLLSFPFFLNLRLLCFTFRQQHDSVKSKRNPKAAEKWSRWFRANSLYASHCEIAMVSFQTSCSSIQGLCHGWFTQCEWFLNLVCGWRKYFIRSSSAGGCKAAKGVIVCHVSRLLCLSAQVGNFLWWGILGSNCLLRVSLCLGNPHLNLALF